MALDPIGVALRVAQLLESLDIPYLVGGALASDVLGEPRATEDIDIVADIRPAQADALIGAQWRDVLGLLKVQADRIDRAYPRRWADAIAVTDLLGRAFREAGFQSSG